MCTINGMTFRAPPCIYQVLNKTLISQFILEYDFKISQTASGNTVQ